MHLHSTQFGAEHMNDNLFHKVKAFTHQALFAVDTVALLVKGKTSHFDMLFFEILPFTDNATAKYS